MHPFSLTKEQIEQVSGGTTVDLNSGAVSMGGAEIGVWECSLLDYESGFAPTTTLGEDGELTTLAIGEEGGGYDLA